MYIDIDWDEAVDEKRSTSRYFSFVGSNLVKWRRKIQNVVACSNVKIKYRASLWLKFLLQDIGYSSRQPIRLYCDD